MHEAAYTWHGPRKKNTDILNLVPFVGVASIQTIQAQIPGLEYDEKPIRVTYNR
jgi:hypothetical protein